MVRPELLGSERALESFLFEARATARFNHPHIVTVYGAGEVAGLPYVALEYVDGVDLSRRMRQGPLERGQALAIALAVAEALAEAHQRGVVHRDLKPANVMLASDGRVRVVDFGLAKAFASEDAPPSLRALHSNAPQLTRAGAGTPRYMAPEQWRMEQVESPADIWSFGVMVYEMVTGRRLFEAESEDELASAVCLDDRPSLAELPGELRELVAACLARDPAARPTATEAVTRLRRLSAAGGAQVATAARSARPRVLGALALAAAVGGGVVIGAYGRAPELPRLEAQTAVAREAAAERAVASVPGAGPNAAAAPDARSSASSSARPSAAAQPPGPALPPFNEAGARAAIDSRVYTATGACRALPGSRHISGTVTFDPPSGRIVAVDMLPPAGHEMTGRCVEGLLMGTTIRPFRPPAVQRGFQVSLPPPRLAPGPGGR
jgi:serine/threonine-protein kinase